MVEREQGDQAASGGRRAEGSGRPLRSIFDGLGEGPLDMATVEVRLQADIESRALACLGRVLRQHGMAKGGPSQAGPESGPSPKSS